VDALTYSTLVPAGNNLRFAPSPDGRQIALMSPGSLSFVNIDGSELRQDVLSFAQVGIPGPLFPTGVWAQDSLAFMITGSLETDPGSGLNFTIWRTVDGSHSEPLAPSVRAIPAVAFSPDGSRWRPSIHRRRAARNCRMVHHSWLPTLARWLIPMSSELAMPFTGRQPGTLTGTLMQLCPGATSDSDVCDAPISFSGTAATLRWIDAARVLLLTRDPSALFLVSLDGTSQPIVAWPLEEWVDLNSFTAAGAAR
jgi:hypothetical protein